jgi:hypothetical protein
VADFAEGKIGKAPRELTKAQDARDYKTLPRLLGLDDQDEGEMRRMRAAFNVYEAFASMSGAGNKAEWGNANPGALDIILDVRLMRQEDDDGE